MHGDPYQYCPKCDICYHSECDCPKEANMFTITDREEGGYFSILDQGASIAQTKAVRAAKRIVTALEVMQEVNRLAQYIEDTGICPECPDYYKVDDHAEHCHIGRILEAADVTIG